MKLIALTQGLFAEVDDADYEALSAHRWNVSKSGSENTFYAKRNIRSPSGKGQVTIRMHREIIKAAPGVMVDHWDGNGLNNRRSNLRVANGSSNQANRVKPRHYRGRPTSSQYKGVHQNKNVNYTKRWEARIAIRYSKAGQTFLGSFGSEIEAAQAYDRAAAAQYGSFARLNFPENKNLTKT